MMMPSLNHLWYFQHILSHAVSVSIHSATLFGVHTLHPYYLEFCKLLLQSWCRPMRICTATGQFLCYGLRTKRWATFSIIWIISTLQALFSEHLLRSQPSNGYGAGVRDPARARVKGLDHYDWRNYLHEKECEWLRTGSRLS